MIKRKPSNELYEYDKNKMLVFFVLFISVSLYFGIITCGAGLFGVLLGSELGRQYDNIYVFQNIDA
jgi:hypothetical protein